MPKRKTLPPSSDYEGIGRNPSKAYIQKSRPLQTLAETGLTLPEFKILDAYLARIDSHNPDKRTVKLEKGELERYLGISRILKEDLNQRLRHLFQTIEVKDENKRKGFKLINLFEEADAEQDENGLWQVTLTCTQSAREYVFNIDNIGYLRYRLKNVINLTSRYSYVLFLYLVDNRFRKTWKIDLSELKILMSCTADRYKEFKFFNSEILKKCQKEINEKTDLKFNYKPFRKGRKVSEIEFSVDTLSDELAEALDLELTEPIQMKLDEEGMDSETQNLLLLSSACDDEFNIDEMKVIFAIISTIDLPEHESGIQIARFHYLRERYTMFQIEAGKKDIKNHFLYFKKMIENDKKKSSKGN